MILTVFIASVAGAACGMLVLVLQINRFKKTLWLMLVPWTALCLVGYSQNWGGHLAWWVYFCSLLLSLGCTESARHLSYSRRKANSTQ